MTTSEEVLVLGDLKMSELKCVHKCGSTCKRKKKGGGDNTKYKDGEKEDWQL